MRSGFPETCVLLLKALGNVSRLRARSAHTGRVMYQQVESGRDSKKDGKRSLFGEEHETSVVRGSLLVLRCGAKPVDARCAKPALPYIE